MANTIAFEKGEKGDCSFAARIRTAGVNKNRSDPVAVGINTDVVVIRINYFIQFGMEMESRGTHYSSSENSFKLIYLRDDDYSYKVSVC
jgi:hypothetical protein